LANCTQLEYSWQHAKKTQNIRPRRSIARGQESSAPNYEESAPNQDTEIAPRMMGWARDPRKKHWCWLCGRTFRYYLHYRLHLCDLGRLGPKEKKKWLE